MTRFVDLLCKVLSITEHAARVEKRQAEMDRETREALRGLREDFLAIERRLLVLETRYDGLSHAAATEARAAAQSAATLAAGGELRTIGERIARLETSARPTGNRALRAS